MDLQKNELAENELNENIVNESENEIITEANEVINETIEAEATVENPELVKKQAKSAFNRIGIALTVFFVTAAAFQILLGNVLYPNFLKNIISAKAFSFLNILLPMYGLAFPLYLLITRKQEKTQIEKHNMKFGQMVQSIFMMVALIALGGMIGLGVQFAIVSLLGGSMQNVNATADLVMGSNPIMRTLVVGILAPIVEEMIFRKIFIDRVVKYGEVTAIVLSGLLFGLFHGNFFQFFFATLMGMFSAYIYVRTGRIWYSIGLHMAINLTNSVLTTGFMEMVMKNQDKVLELSTTLDSSNMTPEQSLEVLAYSIPVLLLGAWLICIFIMAIVGAVMWIVTLAKKKIQIKPAPCQVKNGVGNGLLTFGIISFIFTCLVLFANNLLGVYVATH